MGVEDVAVSGLAVVRSGKGAEGSGQTRSAILGINSCFGPALLHAGHVEEFFDRALERNAPVDYLGMFLGRLHQAAQSLALFDGIRVRDALVYTMVLSRVELGNGPGVYYVSRSGRARLLAKRVGKGNERCDKEGDEEKRKASPGLKDAGFRHVSPGCNEVGHVDKQTSWRRWS